MRSAYFKKLLLTHLVQVVSSIHRNGLAREEFTGGGSGPVKLGPLCRRRRRERGAVKLAPLRPRSGGERQVEERAKEVFRDLERYRVVR